MAYEWALIPYPYLRAFNLFTAFVLTGISVGIISALSIETHTYFMNREENVYNFEKLEQQNNVAHVTYHPGKNIFKTESQSSPYNYREGFKRILNVSLVSTIISFIVYMLMYFIFGFGGSMVTIRRKYRLFSSIPG